MSSPGLRNSRAFMLLEVMIGLSILSVGLLVLLRGFSFALRSIGTSSGITRAGLLAEDKLSEVRSGAISLSESLSGDFGQEAEGYTYQIDIEKIAKPEWKQEVEAGHGLAAPDTVDEDGDEDKEGWLNKVAVTVSWIDRAQAREVSLCTYIAARQHYEEHELGI